MELATYAPYGSQASRSLVPVQVPEWGVRDDAAERGNRAGSARVPLAAGKRLEDRRKITNLGDAGGSGGKGA
jgi:hypothetical protein